MAAASRRILAASMTLKPAQGAVVPVSSIISFVNSPTLASMISAALAKIVRRCSGPVLDHAEKALEAASIVAATSSGPAAGAVLHNGFERCQR